MKKAFGQTVRDIKREVNKTVLKVPRIEQKVLDATSNEAWGPHGSILADIAEASRNYHEYQMIMSLIWKRLSDTGKNWRHVYKALIVLDYLVANGSERVIDEIREHAYQISILSDFQYIDSSGRDQGNNVRKKSQSLVVLVNDKEKIMEVREKAAANRDKFRSTSSASGMYRPSSYSNMGGLGDRHDDDRYEGRYGSRDEDKNGSGYGREKEYGSRDDDRRGRNGDFPSRDGDRYGQDYEERYERESYRDEGNRDNQGRSRSVDNYQNGTRGRSSDRDRNHASEDDDQFSSRSSGARADDQSQDGRHVDRKLSDQNTGGPPSYEEAVNESQSPNHSERDGKVSTTTVPRAVPPPVINSPRQSNAAHVTSVSPANKESEAFDEFDPRGSISAVPTASNNAEMDLLGSLSDPFSSNALAIVPTANSEPDAHSSTVIGLTSAATSSASSSMNQTFEDSFGESPFKAIPSAGDVLTQSHAAPSNPFQTTETNTFQLPRAISPMAETASNFDIGESFSPATNPANSSTDQPPENPLFLPQEASTVHNTDILADILPPSGPSPAITSQLTYPVPSGQPQNVFSTTTSQPAQFTEPYTNNFGAGPMVPIASNMALQPPSGPAAGSLNSGMFIPQGGSTSPYINPQVPTPGLELNNNAFLSNQGSGSTALVTSHLAQSGSGPAAAPPGSGNFHLGLGSQVVPVGYQASLSGLSVQHNSNALGNFVPQAGPNSLMPTQPVLTSSTSSLTTTSQPSNSSKFETKSTVWADTLSRGLVNLNISGPKTNPLADIGIDFDSINRKEKRMERTPATPVTSTVTMGKAMGSGSGIGRASAGALRPGPQPNLMMGQGPGLGMGYGPGVGGGMGIRGYGVMNQQPMGMNQQPMGMGMNQQPMGMGMNQQPMGMGINQQPMGMGINQQPMGMGINQQPMGMGINQQPMGMGMGMGQGVQMQPSTGSNIPSSYNNPMMNQGSYAPQQPYGGGYR